MPTIRCLSPSACVPVCVPGPGDSTLQALVVRNNSIHTSTPNSIGISVGDQDNAHVVVGNAMESTATSGFGACLALNLATSSYAAVDNNVCGYQAGAQREWEIGSGSLAQWRVATGFELASLATTPGFRAPVDPDLDLSALTPSAVIVDRGHPTLSPSTDIDGATRAVPPDAGAKEYGDRLFADGFDGS